MPLDPVPGPVNFVVRVHGLKPNQLVKVVNRAGELGLRQPGGITREHLRAAMGRTRGTDIYSTLNTLNRNFHKFDKNGNGRIEHGDVAGIVDENLGCIPGWVRNRFGISRQAAIQQGTAILENDFGVKRP